VADLQRIVPDTIVDDRVMLILDPADADGFPDSTADLAPRDPHAGIGGQDLAVLGVGERLVGSLLPAAKTCSVPLPFATVRPVHSSASSSRERFPLLSAALGDSPLLGQRPLLAGTAGMATPAHGAQVGEIVRAAGLGRLRHADHEHVIPIDAAKR
jgi:hypothetical protein